MKATMESREIEGFVKDIAFKISCSEQPIVRILMSDIHTYRSFQDMTSGLSEKICVSEEDLNIYLESIGLDEEIFAKLKQIKTTE